MIRVNPPELLRRYAVERKGLMLALLVNNAIAVFMAALFSQSPHKSLLVFPAVWSALWTLMPAWKLAWLSREEALASRDRLEGFSVSDRVMSFNIALTTGSIRHAMRKKGKGFVQLPWDNIQRLIVHPERVLRSHEPQHKHLQHVIPGYYELQLKPDAADAAGLPPPLGDAQIQRDLLAAHEVDILNFIETNTQVPVERRDR